MCDPENAGSRAVDNWAALRKHVVEDAVIRGDFTLSSGQKSSYYVDLRALTLRYDTAPLIGQVMLSLLAPRLLQEGVWAVGGLTMGADPVAAAIMHAAHRSGFPQPLHSFVVRKQAKAHGRGRRIEGPPLRGRKVIVVEDTTTTGNSPLAAIRAAEEAGAQVAGVAVVVDRATGARQRLEDLGYPYAAAFSLEDLGLEDLGLEAD